MHLHVYEEFVQKTLYVYEMHMYLVNHQTCK